MPQPVQASTYTFRDIIENGCLYVDKTRYLYELVRHGKGTYFLARPRRFGKSLMISTLEEIFLGNKTLFAGLWITGSDYNWQRYPIIRFDFSKNSVRSAARLEQVLDYFLETLALQHNLTLRGFDYQSRLDNLIQQLAAQGEKVVILVDEYDKPLIDNLDNLPEALLIREILKNFYTVIKALDRHLRFVFITGISKFSKVGVFSSMNNLDDLTMDPRFATALGITEAELRQDFQEHLTLFAQQEGQTVDTLLQTIRNWYNGFCFVRECERVYNPYSTLQLFNKRYFANYWFETGTPTFLTKLIKAEGYDIRNVETLELTELGFSTYELERLEIIPLLFQTGYLTIKSYNPERRLYQLGYPNQEVESAFLAHLLAAFNDVPKGINEGYLWQLIDALTQQDLARFFAVLAVFFADIDYDLHLAQEKYYQTIFYLLFRLMGITTNTEVKTNVGRIDAVVTLPEQIFLFEFKLDQSAAIALQQIKDRDYAAKYRGQGKSIILVGVNFDSRKRTVTEWVHEVDPR
ncbi:MAG: ATP-binding protein [Caldilineaceae bacterium]|nr:ATP-binding protein [Caldilineaceae bacterium]